MATCLDDLVDEAYDQAVHALVKGSPVVSTDGAAGTMESVDKDKGCVIRLYTGELKDVEDVLPANALVLAYAVVSLPEEELKQFFDNLRTLGDKPWPEEIAAHIPAQAEVTK